MKVFVVYVMISIDEFELVKIYVNEDDAIRYIDENQKNGVYPCINFSYSEMLVE